MLQRMESTVIPGVASHLSFLVIKHLSEPSEDCTQYLVPWTADPSHLYKFL